MSNRTTGLLLALLLATSFGLAAWLQPRSLTWRGQRAQADTMFKVLLGDSRRIFASHFFAKADVYLHSGFYPSIFDQAKLQCEHVVTGEAEAHEDGHEAHAGEAPAGEEHDRDHDFSGPPKDWIDRFSRRFRITEHTHLDTRGVEREILPWLKLSAELDPQRVEFYTVAAYWLRTRLGKAAEAEEFLRDGQRANPDSPDILFELGRLIYEHRQDVGHARNVWELALRKWLLTEAGKPEPDKFLLGQILGRLAMLEDRAGNDSKAIEYLQRLKLVSPQPEAIEKQIEAIRHKARPTEGAPAAIPR